VEWTAQSDERNVPCVHVAGVECSFCGSRREFVEFLDASIVMHDPREYLTVDGSKISKSICSPSPIHVEQLPTSLKRFAHVEGA
jgi:hypothetical protein